MATQDEPYAELEVYDADFPDEPTAPSGRVGHIELVEEIPTGHATQHALEVTTLAADGAAGFDDLLELSSFVPRALDMRSAADVGLSCACSCHAAALRAELATRRGGSGRDGSGRDGSAPDGSAPDGSAPDGFAPDGPAPDGPAPDGSAIDAPPFDVSDARPCERHGRIGAGLEIEPDVEDALFARVREQPAARRIATVLRAADRALDELVIDRGALRSLVLELGAARDPDDPVRIVIRGRRGSGRHATIAALAARLGRRIACVDGRRLPRGAARAAALQRELIHALGSAAIPVISGIESHDGDDPATAMAVAEILRGHPGPLVVRTAERARVPLDGGHLDVVLAPLSELARQRAFAGVLERLAIPASAEALAAHHRIGPGTFTDAALEARRRIDHSFAHSFVHGRSHGQAHGQAHGGDPGDEDPTTIVDAVLRQQLAARIAGAGARVTRLASWNQVLLPEATLDGVRELLGRARHGRIVLEDWGYERFASEPGLSALFHGPPGTGKTMIAGLVARELGAELYRVEPARWLAGLAAAPAPGTPAGPGHALDELFDAAEDAGAVLLFDDVDQLGRGPALEALLHRLETFRGVAIVTTSAIGSAIGSANDLGGAPDVVALLQRRLAMQVRFALPDERLRARLWAAHLTPELPTSGPLDLARLAQQFALSGGSIRSSALRAAFLAAHEHSPVTQAHLERAVACELRTLGERATFDDEWGLD
jgi:ATPase family associated with various cellular activities (AAA)